jgi:hypothetical protein
VTTSWWERNRPAILLIALSITFAELLTGSTPVLTIFLSPLALPFLVALYGSGVLFVRELSLRWRTGWAGVVLLGVAYGVLEEAFATKTFFDPAPAHLLGVFGHFLGVNWVWAAELAVFHSVFSITLPILLVSVAFPRTAGLPFFGPRGLRVLALSLLVTGLFMFFAFDPSYPVAPWLLGAGLITIGAFVGAARRFGARLSALADRVRPRPAWVAWFAGGLFVWLFFADVWIGPALLRVPSLLIGIEILLVLLLGWVALGAVQGPDRPRRIVLLAAGLLSFSLVLASVLELVGDWGAAVPVALVVVFLFLLYRTQRRAKVQPAVSGSAPPTLRLPG